MNVCVGPLVFSTEAAETWRLWHNNIAHPWYQNVDFCQHIDPSKTIAEQNLPKLIAYKEDDSFGPLVRRLVCEPCYKEMEARCAQETREHEVHSESSTQNESLSTDALPETEGHRQ